MDYRKFKKFKEEHKVFYWIKDCNHCIFKIKEAFEIFIGGESEIIAIDGDNIKLLLEHEKALLFSNYEEAVNKAKELKKRSIEVLDKAIFLVHQAYYQRPGRDSSKEYAKKFKDLVDAIEHAYKDCVIYGLIKSDPKE